MKRFTVIIMALITAFSLASCAFEGNTDMPSDTGTKPESSQVSEQKPTESKASQKSESQKKTAKAESSKQKTANTVQSSKAAHTHKYTAVKTAATCKAKGYTTYTCSCGDSYKDNYVDGSHEYVNNKCKYCGKVDIDSLYTTLKAWVLKNGKVNGDYIGYSASSDVYGGYSDENFSLYYWNDTDTLEFCLHSPINETYSHNFYIRIPKKYNGNYEYISSYYYRDNGESKYESKGVIEAAAFTSNYPLKSTSYYGAAEKQNSFLEESRIGICDTLKCIKQFLQKENTGYTLNDLGFTEFS